MRQLLGSPIACIGLKNLVTHSMYMYRGQILVPFAKKENLLFNKNIKSHFTPPPR